MPSPLPTPWLPADRLAVERDTWARVACYLLADGCGLEARPIARDVVAMRDALLRHRYEVTA